MTFFVESPSPIPPPASDLATLHALPISERPRRTWAQSSNAVAFGVVFILGCVLINVAQFVLLPLRVLHLFPFGRRLYDGAIRRSKGAFGTLLGEVYDFTLYSPPEPTLECLVILRGRLLMPRMDRDQLMILSLSDDVFVVRAYEVGDHIRDQRAGEIHPGRAREVGGKGFLGKRVTKPSRQVGVDRQPSGKAHVYPLLYINDNDKRRYMRIGGESTSLFCALLCSVQTTIHLGTRGALPTS